MIQHEYSVKKLNNGSDLLVINVPNRQTYYFSAAVRGGFNYAPDGKWELPHLLEHMFFNGNENYPEPESFDYEIERAGAYSNGGTGNIRMNFYYKCGEDSLEKVIDLGMAQVTKPLLNEQAFKKEKRVVKRELERRVDDPYRPCGQNLGALINEIKPSDKQRIASLGKITLSDVQGYYRDFFVTENTFFVLSGSFTEAGLKEIISQIDSKLQDYPKGTRKELKYSPLKDFKERIVAVNSERAEQDCFDLTFVTKDYNVEIAPDLKVFHAIYNYGAFSRIFRRLREKGLSYHLDSGFSIGKDYSEVYLTHKSKPDIALKIFDAALYELADILKGNFTAEEFERARGYVLGTFERSYQNPEDFTKFYYSSFIDGEPLIDFNGYLENLRNMNKEEMLKVAQEFFNSDGWALSLLGKDIKKQTKEYRAILEKYF